jgi:hypothetical protein
MDSESTSKSVADRRCDEIRHFHISDAISVKDVAMRKTHWIPQAIVLVSAALGCLVAGVRGQAAGTRAEFMRRKLEYSKLVLEGLTREDFPKIVKNAKALKAMSEAADWAEMDLPNPKFYASSSMEFRRLTDLLVEKAHEKNLDGSTLTFTQLTVNCVDCHTHIRRAKK